ncbi:hypothetical protein OV079_52045 [Nannocystis pusilla]|uniref:Uncharacterized protein n=1 Tax=Nannocystis pusilla TaxID=889268 RepID=A0A9X3F0U5_9BACT|nr:hypothetical protein [Nannocystis pusilla]MCY1013924.1 hypothetical protein [Nannocystis pusilla]
MWALEVVAKAETEPSLRKMYARTAKKRARQADGGEHAGRREQEIVGEEAREEIIGLWRSSRVAHRSTCATRSSHSGAHEALPRPSSASNSGPHAARSRP